MATAVHLGHDGFEEEPDVVIAKDSNVISTSCHCGAVVIEMARKPRRMTACNCSICRRYGAIWAYFQRKTVRVIAGPSCLIGYTWRNGVRRYLHCRLCGCVTHYERAQKRSDGSDTLAVNMRNINDPSLIASVPIKLLDGASSWDVLDETLRPELFGSGVGRASVIASDRPLA